MGFSREFNIQALQFDAGLRDAGHPGLSPDDLVRAFQLKLRGGVSAQVDAAIRTNAMANHERRANRRPEVQIGIQDLFREAETFALQSHLGNGGGRLSLGSGAIPAVGTSAVVAGGTTPMELDALKLEINALRDSFKAQTGKGEF
jgi:hypothetical protein